ncbi:MAG: hypothetical protein ACXAEU_06255 [Candidatus Hodarchaeales archaeon]
MWDIDFYLMSLENEWWDDNGNSSAVPSPQEVVDAGQTFLGSTQEWNYQGADGQTDDYNHGFDILFACTGEGASNGGGTWRQGNWVRFSMNEFSVWKYAVLLTIHEFQHLYHVLDGEKVSPDPTPSGYVMFNGTAYDNGPGNPPHSYDTGYFRIDNKNNYEVFAIYKDSYNGL